MEYTLTGSIDYLTARLLLLRGETARSRDAVGALAFAARRSKSSNTHSRVKMPRCSPDET